MALRVWLPLTGSVENLGSYQMIFNQGTRIGWRSDIPTKVSTTTAYWPSTTMTGSYSDMVATGAQVPAFFNECIQSHSFSFCAWAYPVDRSMPLIFGDYSVGLTCNSFKGVSSNTAVTSKWQHFAGTYDTETGITKFYIDGVLKNAATGSPFFSASYSSRLLIGRNPNNSTSGSTTYWAYGSIQDVRIYDHCLSAREVQELAKGLIAHYPLSDPQVVNKIYDCSGHGHHLPVTTAPTVVSPSPRYSRGIMIKNPATDAQRVVGTVRMPISNSACTTAIWVKGTTTGVIGGYGMSLCIATSNYEMSIPSSSGALRLGYTVNGTRKVNNYGSGILDGNWHHIAGTYDGSMIRAYKDGVLIGSMSATGNLAGGALTLGIGNYGASSGYGLTSGSYCDARVYSTCLSGDQIRELYNNPISVCKGGTLMCMEAVE